MAYYGKIDVEPYFFSHIPVEQWIKTHPEYTWDSISNHIIKICNKFMNEHATPDMAHTIESCLSRELRPLLDAKLINEIPQFRVNFSYNNSISLHVKRK